MVIGKKPDSNCISFVNSAFSMNILLICFSVLSFQQVVNASCLFTDGQVGQCVKFEECRSAVILSQKGVTPGFCSIEENTVCCVDYKNGQTVRRPEAQTGRKWTSQASASSSSVKDTPENDPNFQRKKHSVGVSNNGNHGKRKTNAEIIEDVPYQFEKPNTYYDEGRHPARPHEDNHFVPPGLAKKKTYREEKTTENDYYYESVTKKPCRGPSRKGSNKHTGNDYESNNSRRWGSTTTTRRPEWSDGSKRPTGDWYNGQNEYDDNYFNQRTTTKRNNWGHEDYTTTKRPDYFNGGDEYYNVKPTRRPQSTSRPSGSNPNRPSSQGSPNKGSKRPNYQGGSNFEGNRPNYNQGTGSGGNRPTYQQGNNFQSNRPSYQHGNNFENNRPNYQQGNNFENNRPNYQQGNNFENNRPNYQQGNNFENNRPNSQQGSNFEGNRPNSRPGSQRRKSISERKCEEYSKQITKNITGLPLTTNPDPVTIPIRKCITPQQLIVGGENTTLGEFPHMAAIGFRDRNKKQIAWSCGGTLISDLYVMTAAHCTSTPSGRPVKVRLGEYNLMKNDDGAYPVDYTVVDIITHPDYKPPSKYNDIALLKLSRKVTFYNHIRPACLYSEETFSATKAIATGWGRTYYDGGTSDILQKVVLSIIDNFTCNRLYKVNVKTEQLARGIVDSQLCAGELTGGKDTCQGDSGGPLSITNTKCIHHVIGITSFGKSCALPNSTGVYTRVSAYVPWIESVVWPQS